MKPCFIGLLIAGVGLTGTAVAAAPAVAPTRDLLAVVDSQAELAERARALQQLAIVGTPEAVPVLAGLLADEKLGQYARDALEQMPDPAAAGALRAALGRLQGRALLGVIGSLGARRDSAAVEPLGRLAQGVDPAVANAALVALGKIGDAAAGRVLEPALASAEAGRRAAAAEGCLLAAERLAAAGDRTGARTILAKVRRADVPSTWRVAATRGEILQAGAEGLSLLLEQLRSGSPEFRELALGVARELRGPATAAALIGEMDRLSPAWQAAVIATLVDLGGESALKAAEARATAGVEEVRVAALRALGTLGRASSVPLLLAALRPPTSETVAAAAVASLTRIQAPGADEAIVATLANAPAELKVRLIGVLGDRKAGGVTGELMKLAAGTEVEIAKAALRALGLVTGPAGLPQLIALAIAVRDEEVKTLADRAIVMTAMKVLEPERRAEAVLQAFQTAADPATKAALLRPLGAIMRTMGGNHEVFFVVRTALQDSAEPVRLAALRCLSDWPDATPTSALLEVAARKDATPAQREMALRGATRMAGNVAAGRERSPLNALESLAQANRAAHTKEERMMVVAALGSVRRLEAVALLQPYLEDADLKAAAALAIVQVATALPGPKAVASLKTVLERIAASGPDEEVRRRAARLAKGGPAEPKGQAGKAGAAAGLPPPAAGQLFNGVDLAGWDGDPGVWRVRDGVIVGGSKLGNPRNEFLATTRRYRDFVLRLEYRLVGTEGFVNGGVQVRSVRVAQPPNEMSGYQADIGAGHSGCLYDESRRKKFLARATDEQIKRLEKPGDWNRYEIRCVGPKVELTLNGERTVLYTDEDPSVLADGLIALQIHGNCKAEIGFRNLTIEEL